MKIILLITILVCVSCGKKQEGACLTREQVYIQCIAEGITLRPNPAQLQFVKLDCTKQYPVEMCYKSMDKYFPYDY